MKTKHAVLLFIFAIFIPWASLNAQQIKKTKILILGTYHLNSIDGVKETHLTHLLDSLSAYKFDAIAIEQMPPELILDIKSRRSETWQELYSKYSKSIILGDGFQKKFKLDYESASKLLDSLAHKQNLNEADRKQLMYAALCSYDTWTASLNFQYLQDKSSLDTTIVQLMHKYNQSTNEINLICVNLAKRHNIKILNQIDNLQDETILIQDFPSFYTEYAAAKDEIYEMVLKATIFSEVEQLKAENIKNMDLFPLYKLLNSDRYMKEDYIGQWELWLKTNFSSKSDRSRYSLWEMRNLQITANIMNVAAKFPEKNILVVIGASHKAFIEKYLKQMTDIELLKF